MIFKVDLSQYSLLMSNSETKMFSKDKEKTGLSKLTH